MFLGMPVAFTFLVVNLIGSFIFFGGIPGLFQLVIQISESLTSFTLVPVGVGAFSWHSDSDYDRWGMLLEFGDPDGDGPLAVGVIMFFVSIFLLGLWFDLFGPGLDFG